MTNVYKVTSGKKKMYLPQADAFEYASHGYKISKVKKFPKGYKI